jgi:saccharopine dehydrogenase (NAD+, L-lysine-forming)
VGPNPYDLTADAGVRIAGYLAAGAGPAGPIEPGAHTPATALGAGFVTELDGVVVNEVVVSDG